MPRKNVDFVAGILKAAEDMDRETLLAALPDLVARSATRRWSGSRTLSAPRGDARTPPPEFEEGGRSDS
jgi:hypothetical protein